MEREDPVVFEKHEESRPCLLYDIICFPLQPVTIRYYPLLPPATDVFICYPSPPVTTRYHPLLPPATDDINLLPVTLTVRMNSNKHDMFATRYHPLLPSATNYSLPVTTSCLQLLSVETVTNG